ncbi:hypothetical protein SERLA73DRAFT_76815 [Serpula lacrymans var. lacrymans S7.3]|uniref:Fanconi-associated nuclease n=1 Tax=Serpula lacrymans var. lacrymans (strain S7.3) TaxID=936435 RepID=F8Q861_SERL3|nr:hypothetical protein SERLA73DRAFT_76815 [Serpula lacrymans var. lacrymans S7.3]
MSRLVYSGGDVDYQGPRLNDDGEEDEEDIQELEEGPAENQGNVKLEGVKRRESMYVTLFEDMLKTVLGGAEEALFLEKEIDYFYYFSRLSYNARYLIIRLLLRRPDKWHRLDSLKYQAELGTRANIIDAIKELCKFDEEVEIKAEEQEVIDLTLDDYDTYSPPSLPQVQAQAGPSTCAEVKDEPPEPDLTVLAEDESKMDLRCLLECLTVDELKSFAKDMKVKTVQKRAHIISALLNVAPAQTTFDFMKRRVSSLKTGAGGAMMKSFRQTTLSFIPGQKCKTQHERLREMVIAKLGKCIKVSSAFQKLVRRAHLVCFRLTQHAQTLLTSSILCQAKKRCYPAYAWSRTPDIWPSREALMAYEEALELEAQVDAIFDGSVPTSFVRGRSAASKTPARVTEHRFRTPSTPGSVLRPSISDSSESPDQKGKGKARFVEDADEGVKAETKDDSPRVQEARAVKAIFEEIYPRWQAQVITKGEEDGRRFGLERFDCGHVLTRIVCKGAYALGILKDHRYELQILEELLGQKRWRRGRRGKWHDRRALILMTHFPKDEATALRALDAVVEALEDTDTHIICRPMLERRLCRLEKRLGHSSEERHTSEGKLMEAIHVVIQGIRIHSRAAGLILDRMGRSVKKIPAASSNGQNIHMLFGLLFWDIIFAPVPGAFETPFQSAPLDIAEDSFYHSRKEIIEQRLEELESGKDRISSGERMTNIDPTELTVLDLIEIVTCLGGTALSVICRLLCEDYAGRGSGGPDLFIWDAQKTLCKFVEVKGPGDSLQENQKVWIDVLLRASVAVEVCRVKEEGEVPETSFGKGKKRKSKTKTKKEGHRVSEPEERFVESEDEPDELPSALPSVACPSQTVVVCPTASRAKGSSIDNTPSMASAISPEFARTVSTDDQMDWTPSQGRGKKRRTLTVDIVDTPSKKPRLQVTSSRPQPSHT